MASSNSLDPMSCINNHRYGSCECHIYFIVNAALAPTSGEVDR